MSVSIKEPELKKVMWKHLGSMMTDSGEMSVDEVDADFQKVLDAVRADYPMLTRENELKWGENWMDELLTARQKWFKKYFGAP